MRENKRIGSGSEECAPRRHRSQQHLAATVLFGVTPALHEPIDRQDASCRVRKGEI